jgi:hypothetical protein
LKYFLLRSTSFTKSTTLLPLTVSPLYFSSPFSRFDHCGWWCDLTERWIFGILTSTDCLCSSTVALYFASMKELTLMNRYHQTLSSFWERPTFSSVLPIRPYFSRVFPSVV